MTRYIVIILLYTTALYGGEQTSLISDSTRIDYVKLGIFTGVSTSVFIYSQLKQSSQYWHNSTSFYTNFNDDWKYAHGADKFGHAFAASIASSIVKEGCIWSGIDTVRSLWLGFGAALINQTLVEVRDGFSQGNGELAPYLGFSFGDAAANVIGASYPIAQYYLPVLRQTRYKYSLNPSPRITQGGYYSSILNDYESEYHWLSFNIHDLLPRSVQQYWTPFLNIAIGHSVKNIVDAPNHYSNNGYHELWLSLDYNVEAIPCDAGWLTNLKKLLNFYKLPAPCVRILPSVVWYGIRL